MPVKHLSLLVPALLLTGCVAPLPVTPHSRGYVIDAKTKRPISGACVTVQNHPKATAFTASDGSFDIPAETRWGFIVPPVEPTPVGTLIISKDGYRQRTAEASYGKQEISLEPK